MSVCYFNKALYYTIIIIIITIIIIIILIIIVIVVVIIPQLDMFHFREKMRKVMRGLRFVDDKR